MEKIGGSEMLSHQFLTEDRQVQETRFANGWAVVVNFDGKNSYMCENRERITHKLFTAYRWER